MRISNFFIGVFSFFLTFGLFVGIANGDEGFAGTQSNFNLGVGARALALGNAYVAMPFDATAVYWNPAGLDYIQRKNVSLFYTNLLAGAKYFYFGYAHPTINFGSFGFGVISSGVGDIQETDSSAPIELGTFSYSQQEFLLSYGKQLPWNIALGVNLKIDHQSIHGLTDTGVGADFGFLYRPNFTNFLLSGVSVGLTAQNLFGPRLKQISETDISPINIRMGFAKPILTNEWGNQFTIFMDFEQSEYEPFKFHTGTEYVFNNFAMLRVGLNNNQIAFGAGAAISMFQIDYMYGKFSDNPFDTNHRISFSVTFGKSKDELVKIAEQRRLEEIQRKVEQQRIWERDEKISESMDRGKQYLEIEDYERALREFNFITNYESEMPNSTVIAEARKLSEETTQRRDDKLKKSFDEIRSRNEAEKERKELDIFLDRQFDLGLSHYEVEEYEKAIAEWQKMLDRDPNNVLAKEWIPKAQADYEKKILSLINQADNFARKGRYLEAISVLNNARMLNPDEKQINVIDSRSNSYKQQMQFDELFQQGYRYYITKDYVNAMNSFQEALKHRPNNEQVKKLYTDAEARANAKKMRMTPEMAKKYDRGINLYTAGKYEEAIQIWEELLLIQPYNKEILDTIDGAKERSRQQKK
ncbi:MAG: PorV/PorQ family protein [Candidatus Zhuqueibacterota bacterium]